MEEKQDFTIKTEVFEGPLEVLLNLIEKRKLLINDISLAKVTDDYISHVKEIESMPIAKTSHFILIASTLLLIKSKSLLPTLTLSEEEQESIDDLERRLKIYKRFKDLSVGIEERFGKNIMFRKKETRHVKEEFSPNDKIKTENLHSLIKNLISTFPKKEIVPKAVLKKVISLEEMIGKLTERIQSGIQMKFSEFANVGKEEKVNVIVGFLAMLELVKQGILTANQQAKYSDIDMETKEIGIPRY